MGKPKPKLVLMDPAELRKHPANPKLHPKTQVDEIAASLERYGQERMPSILEDGTVLAGWGLTLAARQLGVKLWCKVSDLEGANREGYMLADNATADLGEYDEDLLARLVQAQDEALDGSTKGLGYTEDQVEALLGAALEAANPEPPAVDEPDDVGELEASPVVQVGDVWEVGGQRVVCADSLEPRNLAAFIGKDRVDLVLTDPPYAIYGSSTGVSRKVADDKMVAPFFRSVLRLAAKAVREFGHVYTFTDWRSWARLWDAAAAEGLTASNMLVWDKGDNGLGANFLACHELVAFLQRLPEQKTMGGRKSGQRLVHGIPNILRFPRIGQGQAFERGEEDGEKRHNAQKPVDMLRRLIRASSDKGDRVLDPFLGSGSTLVATALEKRAGIGVELEPTNVELALHRLENVTGERAVRVATGVGTDELAESGAGEQPTLEDLRAEA